MRDEDIHNHGETDAATPLAKEAARVRAGGALGRSDRLIRLFDFLVAESVAGRTPKEAELVHHLSGSETFDRQPDASVRVHVHRLRRKLDGFYADHEGARLDLPRGEYRLVLTPTADDAADVETPAAVPARRVAPKWWALLALVLALNLAAWAAFALWRPADPAETVARRPFWSVLADGARPALVVVGDYYIFGEAPNEADVSRLVREFSINSRGDLDDFLMAHPDLVGRYVDLDLHYLPTSAGPALQSLLPVVNRAVSGARAAVIPASSLSAEVLKRANVVYVGYFSGLGALRDPLFAASGFKVGASYDELIDRASGARYASDWNKIADQRTPRRDFGYLASMPGPAGNRILIVAGTRDAAVMQAAEIAADPAQLDQIAHGTGGAQSFEALFEVRTMGNLNLGSRLVLARPIKAAGAWDNPPPQDFPDRPSTVGAR